MLFPETSNHTTDVSVWNHWSSDGQSSWNSVSTMILGIAFLSYFLIPSEAQPSYYLMAQGAYSAA